MREAKISEGPPDFKDSIAQMAGKMVFVQFIYAGIPLYRYMYRPYPA